MKRRSGALAEYADYCAINTWYDNPTDWLRRRGVDEHDQHEVAITFPDGQTRYRETTGQRNHRWKQGSKTGQSVYWPNGRGPEDGHGAGGKWERVLLVEGESSVLALSAFFDSIENSSDGTFVAGSPGSKWPADGEWTDRTAAAAAAAGQVYAWLDTEPDGRPDPGGKGWAQSIREWSHKKGLTYTDKTTGLTRPDVWEVGPFGIDGRDWIKTGSGPTQAEADQLWKDVRELPAVLPPLKPPPRSYIKPERNSFVRNRKCDNTFSPQEVSVMFSDRVDEWLQEKGATRKPGGWSCGGPGHKRGDRRPSLSVFTTPDGVRGYKCYVAGCWSGNAWSLLMERLGSTQDVFAEAHRLRGCCQPD